MKNGVAEYVAFEVNDFNPKYSKHWPYTVAHTFDCVCSKMLNHGFIMGYFFHFSSFLDENTF